jgi:acyl-CoA synthetase (AMP-forming)/AMP-acid ligase II
MTYGHLDVRSRQLAGWLRRNLGLRPNDRVGLAPANDLASIVAVFAVLRYGCAMLLVNPSDPPGRLQALTEALGVRTLLHSRSVVLGAVPGTRCLPEWSELGDETVDSCDIDPLGDALYFGTSGSTAVSKVVAQSHYNIAVNAYALRVHHSVRPGDRILGCLPIYHVNGLHFSVLGTFVAGAHLVLAPSFHPLTYPRILEQYRPRIASVVPAILEALLDTWRSPSVPSEFEYFVSAAAPLPAATALSAARRFGTKVLQGYGLTETTNFSTTMPADLPADAYARLTYHADIPSIGVPLYGNEVAVLGPDGRAMPPGEVGEICVRGHSVMSRYEGNVAATDEAFRGGWFHSQDLGFAVSDEPSRRSVFFVTGRTKNIAKVCGESVSLDEMERLLRALPFVRDAACAALPHRLLGEEIVAVVVFGANGGEAEVRGALCAAFAPSVVPRRIVRSEAIPRTLTGKVLRPQLAQMLAVQFESAGNPSSLPSVN